MEEHWDLIIKQIKHNAEIPFEFNHTALVESWTGFEWEAGGEEVAAVARLPGGGVGTPKAWALLEDFPLLLPQK